MSPPWDKTKLCRLCMNTLKSDSSVSLFDSQEKAHMVTEKLRQFVNLDVNPADTLPHQVCQSCVINLDFCIQFVDRIRRLNHLLQDSSSGQDLTLIQAELTSHYPYLYNNGSSNVSSNAQTIPFHQGHFFGPSTVLKHDQKVRKILPKQQPDQEKSDKVSDEFTIRNPSNIKAQVQNGQYMIPVTIS